MYHAIVSLHAGAYELNFIARVLKIQSHGLKKGYNDECGFI
jgi:hypothetical protein